MMHSSLAQSPREGEVKIPRQGFVVAETQLAEVTVVLGGQTGVQGALGILLIAKPHPIKSILARLTSVNVIPEKSAIVANNQPHGIPLSGGSALGHNVVNTAYGIRSPNGSAGPANDFHSIQNLQGNVLASRVDRSAHDLKDLPAVHHGEKLLRGGTAEVPHDCKIVVTRATSHVHAGHAPKSFHGQDMTVETYVVRSQNMHRGRIPPIFLLVT